MTEPASKGHAFLIAYLVFAILPIYWMVNMSFKTNEEILVELLVLAAALHLGQLQDHLHRSVLVLGLHQQPDLRGHQHGDLAHGWRCRRPMPSAATSFWATSMCSSGC